MRKAISIILAIAMLVTLMPTFALAADTTADAGITLNYEVTKHFGSWNSTTVRFDSFTYEVNNGLWEYYGNTNGLQSADKSTTINWSGVDGMQMRSGYWAIKINVPKSGVYTPKINYKKYREAAILNLYLIKTGKALEESDMNADTLLGSLNCYDKDLAAVTVQTPAELEPRYIEAGEYYFVYQCGEKMSTSGTGWVFFGNFTLDGNGTDTVLASLFTDKNVAIPMGQTAKITPELYMSDGTEAEGSYAVSYASDSAAVSVASDGTMTANSEGSAKVTASAVNEAGYTVKSEINVVVGNGATIKYDLKKHVATDLGYYEGKKTGSLSAVDETLTNGFYSYFGGNDYNGSAVKYYSSVQIMGTNVKIAFKINVPEAGYYQFIQDVISTQTKRMNVDINVFVSESAMSTAKADLIGYTNAYMPDVNAGTAISANVGTVYFDKPGSYIVTFCVGPKLEANEGHPYALVNSFYLVGGEKTALMNGKISSTAASINVDEKETATVSATGFLSKDASAATFTYSSNDTSVATVDATSGVVTPVKAGKATITATANADVANTLTTDITVTENKPGEEVEDTKVSVGVVAETGGTVETNLSDTVSEVDIGTKIYAEAVANEGYEFAYWIGSNGAVLSTNAKESFVINVNSSIKAVFEKLVTDADTTVPVYFYNGNGEALATEKVEKGETFGEVTKPKPTLTGFAFDKWSIADEAIINTITRAVALFKETNDTYEVKVGDTAVATGKKYGDSVTVNATESNFTCWKLGDKVMSYDASFSFNVYGDMTLTKVCEGAADKVPTVVLDKVEGEYFLAYNVPAGYAKLEAGILFAESGTPTIGSFYAKATEKTGSGQFTAKPNGSEPIARGYLIFRDASGSVRVIYAD